MNRYTTPISSLAVNSNGERQLEGHHLDDNFAAQDDAIATLTRALFSRGGVARAGAVTLNGLSLRVQGRVGVTLDTSCAVHVEDQSLDLTPLTAGRGLVIISTDPVMVQRLYTDIVTQEQLVDTMRVSLGRLTVLAESESGVTVDADGYPSCPQNAVPVARVTRAAGGVTLDGVVNPVPAARAEIGADLTALEGRVAVLEGRPVLDAEYIQDVVGGMIPGATYDDAAGTITLPQGSSIDAEQVRDIVAAFAAAGSNVSISHDDAGDKLTFTVTGTEPTTPASLIGPSSERPVNPAVGTQYYDTTLYLPIWWQGATWQDAAGNAIAAYVPPAAAYRYVRLVITATNGATDRTGVGELILREAVGSANLAQGKPVSSNSNPFGTAAQAVDGSTATDTGWIASAESLPVWLQVDLGVQTAVREYTVHGYGYTGAAATRSPRDWKLQGSNDALAWTDLHTAVAQGGWTDSAGQESRTFAI